MSKRTLTTIGVSSAAACILLAVYGFATLGTKYRSVLGSRARGAVEAGTERSGGDSPNVPTPAKSRYVLAPITITVEPVAPEAEADTPATENSILITPAKVSVAVYGAEWCAPCKRLLPIIEAYKDRGFIIEYRDIDAQPTPHVTVLPTAFFYDENAQPYAKVFGYDSIVTAFQEQLQ